MCAVGNSLGRSSAFYSAGGVSGESNFNLPPIVDQPPFKIRLPPAAALCHELQLQGQRDQPQEGQLRHQSRDVLRRPDSSAIGERRVHDRHLRHQERRFGTVQWLQLVGNGVHFHFIADDAHLKLRGSAHSDFKAMTSGEYAGILFAQPPPHTALSPTSRAAAASVSMAHFTSRLSGWMSVETAISASPPMPGGLSLTRSAGTATARCASKPTSPSMSSQRYCPRSASSRRT
jgi:hypothetical protein